MKKLPIIIIAVLLIGFVYYKFNIGRPASAGEGTVPVTIEAGQSVSSIASTLHEQGLIRSPLVFKIYVQVNGLRNELQAGDYEIPKTATTKEVVDTLQHGTFDVRLTFLEGWRMEEMADYINEENLEFSGVDFQEAAEGYEGKLFPDTYLVPRYTSAPDLVSLMVSNFNQKVGEEVRNGFADQGLSFEEGVTMASIVEREVADDDARKMVAGILLKRLRNDWPLQADATVQYVLGYQTEVDPETGETRSSWWKEHLTNSDLEIDSPYNTRLHPGLPPGPICNPGLESLRAVADPTPSEYWYYLTDSEGNIHYSVTLEEHNEKVSRYIN